MLPEREAVDDEALVSAVLLASRALVAIAARSLAVAPADVTLAQYRLLVLLAALPTAPGRAGQPATAAPRRADAAVPQTLPVALPGGEGGIGFDDLAFAPTLGKLLAGNGFWVPFQEWL